ncbi:FtsX-like permease family protein [Olsenella sp. oral taxon 807]|uniref:FtsX-like permease family protein n=1 Tax=Olsenella sp. oral taxon 807 TaxID=712411 RepID=UPI00067D3DA3|nr:FtsX-like permease family protein [Olsenella sp. oral taxon 807]
MLIQRMRRASSGEKMNARGYIPVATPTPTGREADGAADSPHGSAFAKGVLRSIRGSLGRFLAIMGIVALGCGFYAGLQMCGPNMRLAADRYYDETQLWDLRVVSTLGFKDADVKRIASTEGVSAAVASHTVDVMARLGNEQVAVRISSLGSKTATTLTAADAGGRPGGGPVVNRLILREGRWPTSAEECVVSADVSGASVNDRVEVLSGGADHDRGLRVRKLVVVGTVSSSNYVYTGNLGSTSLASGKIEQCLFVTDDAFGEDTPYTDVYLKVSGADKLQSSSDAYEEKVSEVKGRMEARSGDLSRARQADLRAQAQVTLNEKVKEYQQKRDESYGRLADAKDQLDDAEQRIVDGQGKLDEGQREYDEGLATYRGKRADAERRLSDAQARIDSGRGELDAQRDRLAAGERAWRQGYDQLSSQLASAGVTAPSAQGYVDELDARLTQAEAAKAQLASLQGQLAQAREATGEANRRRVNEGINELRPKISELEDKRERAQGALDVLRGRRGEAQAQLNDLDVRIRDTQANIDRLEAERDKLGPAFSQEQAQSLAAAKAALGKLKDGRLSAQVDLSKLDAAVGEAEATVRTIDEGLATARSSLARLQEAQEQIQEAEQGIPQLEAGIGQIQGRLPSDDDIAALTSARDSAQRLADTREVLDEGASQLSSAQKRLDASQAELRRQRKDAAHQLASAKGRLEAAAGELRRSRDQLAEARVQHDEGLASYTDSKAEVDKRFSKAWQEIQDAQRSIDEIALPDVYTLDRSQSESAATYQADTKRMDNIANVFPLMFFLVAALVALTTMTRMVDDERVQIGTYKALGYGKTRIAGRYLLYALVAAGVGATLGVIVLSQLLPYIIMSAYSIIYAVPPLDLPLPVDWGVALSAAGLGVGVTLLTTWVTVYSSLREPPATLMLPRAPKAGRRILLEHVTPIWRRLSFSWKVTARNLFRYKRRLLMTVIGISGCASLLLVGFGLHDSIWDIIDLQYGPIIHYDTTVGLSDASTELDVSAVTDYLGSAGGASDIVRVQRESMQATGTGPSTSATSKTHVTVIVPQDSLQAQEAVTFRDRMTGAVVAFDDDAVLVTEKLASLYGIKAGDQLMLFDQDDAGNAIGTGHALTVTGVTENYVANLVYVGRGAWRSVSPVTPVFSTIFCNVPDARDVRATVSARLHDMTGVSTVTFSDEVINQYRHVLSVVDMVVVVLIVSAAALAFIVLYNLTNINVEERLREIAALKVLGFTKREVYAYIFREIMLLALMGDVAGMLLGIWLERFVITTAEVDYVMFGRSIHALSFVYAFALTLVFSALVMLVMRRKLDRVDMVESLKSVD